MSQKNQITLFGLSNNMRMIIHSEFSRSRIRNRILG